MSMACNYFVTFLVCSLIISTTNAQHLLQQKIESYAPCRLDKDCKENAFCHGNDDTLMGKCKCMDGYYLNRKDTFYECVAASKLGDVCTSDFQCGITGSSMAFCNRYKLCECQEFAHGYRDGVCYRTTNVTDFCLVEAECRLDDGRFADCTDGRCECRLDERPSSDLRRCVASRHLGQRCAADEECAVTANADCEGVCRCRIDYTLDRGGTTCLKAATAFGQPCIEDAQCSKFLEDSICTTTTCTCPPGRHGAANKCIHTKIAGERCLDAAECLFDAKLKDKIDCVQGRCQCIYGTSSDELGCTLGAFDIKANFLLLTVCIFYLLL